MVATDSGMQVSFYKAIADVQVGNLKCKRKGKLIFFKPLKQLMSYNVLFATYISTLCVLPQRTIHIEDKSVLIALCARGK